MKYFGFKELLNNIFNGPLAFLVKFILMFCGYGKKAGGPDILHGLETPSFFDFRVTGKMIYTLSK